MQALLDLIRENLWIVYTFVVVLTAAIVQYAARVFFLRIERSVRTSKNKYDDAVLHGVRKPLRWGIWVTGVMWAAQIAKNEAEHFATDLVPILDYAFPVWKTAITILVGWTFIRVIRFVETNALSGEVQSFDRHSASAIAKLLRATVVITIGLVVLRDMGVSVEGVLAFGGIGGIAVGFAARDMLANFFGTVMIFLDKPFSEGDWIRSPDREIEGTVEEVGWRMTRIRTFDKRPLYIPNSVFSSLVVENPDRMTNRRIKETIGVRYDDIHVLPKILEDIRGMLKSHVEIDTRQTLMVNLISFGESSVDFFIYTFTKTTVWTRFHEIKEDVMLQIADIIERNGGEIAFPTRVLQIDSGIPQFDELSTEQSA